MEMLRNHGQGVVAAEGQAPRYPFVEHDAERVEISAPVQRVSQRLLRRQVENRSHQRPFGRQPRGQAARQAEIHQFDRPAGGQQHVFWFEIAMNEAVRVGMRQGCAHLPCGGHHRGNAGRRLLVQGDAGNILHDDERRAVGLAGVENGDDVGMIELSCGARFLNQARAALGAQIGGRQDFDSHITFQ